MAVRNPERYMDLRTIHRNLTSGVITKEEVAEHLESLPDVSHKSAVLTLSDDDDDYDGIAPELPVPVTTTIPS